MTNSVDTNTKAARFNADPHPSRPNGVAERRAKRPGCCLPLPQEPYRRSEVSSSHWLGTLLLCRDLVFKATPPTHSDWITDRATRISTPTKNRLTAKWLMRLTVTTLSGFT